MIQNYIELFFKYLLLILGLFSFITTLVYTILFFIYHNQNYAYFGSCFALVSFTSFIFVAVIIKGRKHL